MLRCGDWPGEAPLPFSISMFNSSEMPVAAGRFVVRLANIRKGQAGRFGGGIDAVAEPLASPTIHHEREQVVEDVVIEPATARAAVRSVVDQRAFDLEKAAGREWRARDRGSRSRR